MAKTTKKRSKPKPQKQKNRSFIPVQAAGRLQKPALIFVLPPRPNRYMCADIVAFQPATPGTFVRQ